MTKNLTVLLAPLALCAGCAMTAPEPDAASDFGDAVRNMIQQQTYDAAAAAQPPEQAPNRLDGARADAALKAWRNQSAPTGTAAIDDFATSTATTP